MIPLLGAVGATMPSQFLFSSNLLGTTTLLLTLCLLNPIRANCGNLSLTYTGALPQETEILRAELSKLEQLLPPVMRKTLSLKPIEIRVSENTRHAQVAGRRITIPRAYIQAFHPTQPKTVRSFFGTEKSTHWQDMNQLLRAALAHELMHLFDEDFANINRKISEDQSCLASPGEPGPCRLDPPLISTTRRFVNVFNWHQYSFSGEIERNQFELTRSPAIYETTNAAESLATNFEYFLLDSGYKCRFPSRSAFFRELFAGFEPHLDFTCEEELVLPVRMGSGRLPELRSILPGHLQEVHFMWAGRGPAAMSRFGHAMFRLVICSQSVPPGEACRRDLSRQIVVELAAEIPGDSIGAIAGLNGKYPLLTILKPLSSVLSNYNDTEFREVHSVPLRLNTEQRWAFLQRVAEQVWAYEGKYYFLSRNCTTEAIRMLQAVVQNQALADFESIRPDTFFHFLRSNSELVDTSERQRWDDNRSGFYFPSNRVHYDRLAKFVGEQLGKESVSGISEFSALSTEDRNQMAKVALEAPPSAARRKLLLGLRILLTREFDKAQADVTAKARAQLTNSSAQGSGTASPRDRYFNFRYGLRNASVLIAERQTYGLPNRAEIQSILDNSTTLSRQLTEIRTEYTNKEYELVRRQLPKEVEELLVWSKWIEAIKVAIQEHTSGAPLPTP